MNNLKHQLQGILSQCIAFHHTKEEFAFLNEFVSVLQQTSDIDEDFEMSDLNVSLNRQKFLHEVVHANPAPNFNFELLNSCAIESGMEWTKTEPLDWFLFYVFNRRFGWPDLEENKGNLIVCCLHSINKWRSSIRHEELHFKTKMVTHLDLILLWIFHQPVNLMSLKMFYSAIQLAESFPVTRLNLTVYAMDILKEHFEEIDEEHFQAVQDLILLIMADIWSQIRSAGAARLGPIIERFTLNHLHCLFMRLTQLCRTDGQSWQVVDGAINGRRDVIVCFVIRRGALCRLMASLLVGPLVWWGVANGFGSSDRWESQLGPLSTNVIIKRFHLITYDSNDLHNHKRREECCGQDIRIGQHILTHLPSFILNEMQSLVYILTSNPQLNIRETAIKAFVACIVRCHERESENAFIDVLKRLKGESSIEAGPHANSEVEMDAYTAESLIHLITILYKRIRNYQSHSENWDFLHESFDRYLMHSASSVRLATSNLYKSVVYRNINTPLIVKNIIWCLVRDWKVNQRIIFSRIETFLDRNDTSPRSQKSFDRNSKAWQWLEGCLLVYELFCKLLIKNHCMHAFGSSNQDDNEPSPAAVSPTFSNNSATLMLHDEQSDWSVLSPNSSNEMSECCRSYQRSASVSYNTDGDNVDSQEYSNKFIQEVEPSNTKNTALSTTINMSSSNENPSLNRISNSHPSLNMIDSGPNEDNKKVDNNEDSNNNKNYRRFRNCLHDPTSVKHKCSSFIIHVKEVERLQSSLFSVTASKWWEDISAFVLRIFGKRVFFQILFLSQRIEDSLLKGNSTNDQHLPWFHSLLSKMFYTCVESMVDQQWEVRRIANQTFPSLGELIRWTDPDLLTDLINTHLVCEPRLMTFACLMLLRDTLRHASKLRSPTFSSFSRGHREIRVSIDKFLHTVDSHIRIWLQSCFHYLNRRDSLDCVTVLSSQTVLLAAVHYLNYPTTQQLPILKTLLSVFEQVNELVHGHQPQPLINIYTGLDIYSCKHESCDNPAALRFGIELLMHLKDDLYQFIQQSSVSHSDTLLSLSAIIITWVCPVIKLDSRKGNEMVKIIIKMLSPAANCVASKPNRTNLQPLGYQILQESSNLLLNKIILDTGMLRNLLESLYSLICGLSLNPNEFLHRILVLIPLSCAESLSHSTNQCRRKSCLPSLSANNSDTSLLALHERLKKLGDFGTVPSDLQHRRKSLEFLTEEDNIDSLSKLISEYHEDKKLQLFSSDAQSHFYKETDSSSTASDEANIQLPHPVRPNSSCHPPDERASSHNKQLGEDTLPNDEEFKGNGDDNSFHDDFSSSESIIEEVESDWDSSSSDDEDAGRLNPSSLSDTLLVDEGGLTRGEIAQLRSIMNSDSYS